MAISADLHRFVAHHCGALVHLGRNRQAFLDIDIDIEVEGRR
ncbi:hypothetical protein CZ771_04030 [Actinomycetales bacterium JB111]|nr:hypothetical protein CZ771_04030 [Actinomycetales bacterium JB111]